MPDKTTPEGYDAAHDSAAWVQWPADHFLMTGDDATTVLHKLCSNEIESLSIDQSREAFVCTVQGKIVGHIWATRIAEGLRIMTAPGQAAPLMAHLDRYVIREDVAFTDISAQWRSIILLGPEADEITQQLLGTAPPAKDDSDDFTWTALPGGGGTAVRRADWGGGWLASGPKEAVQQDVVEPLQREGIVNADAALETLRIEGGFPIYGADITEANLPQEVSRDERAISLVKGCYLGQETVARIDAMGHVNWLHVGFRFSTSEPPAPGQELKTVDGKVIARLTASCHSPRFGAIGIGYVRRGHHRPNEKIPAEAGETSLELETCTLPFSASSPSDAG